MKRTVTLLMGIFLVACASQPGPNADDAVADFIAVSELEELRTVRLRMRQQYSYKEITHRYVVLKLRKERYLVEFRRQCRELDQVDIRPDIRRDSNTLRSGIDTIRGCVIDRMFAIDEAQAQELIILGKAPGEQ